jgi:hypothetical protein
MKEEIFSTRTLKLADKIAAPSTIPGYLQIGHEDYSGETIPNPETVPPLQSTTEGLNGKNILYFYSPLTGLLMAPVIKDLTHGDYPEYSPNDYIRGRIDRNGNGSMVFPRKFQNNPRLQIKALGILEKTFPKVDFYIFENGISSTANDFYRRVGRKEMVSNKGKVGNGKQEDSSSTSQGKGS